MLAAELDSARQFLDRSEFSRSSDYYNRLSRIQYRLETRTSQTVIPNGKRNYGGEAAGYVLAVSEPHVALPALMDHLRHSGVTLAGLTTRTATLEDVFVTLTGRHLRDTE